MLAANCPAISRAKLKPMRRVKLEVLRGTNNMRNANTHNGKQYIYLSRCIHARYLSCITCSWLAMLNVSSQQADMNVTPRYINGTAGDIYSLHNFQPEMDRGRTTVQTSNLINSGSSLLTLPSPLHRAMEDCQCWGAVLSRLSSTLLKQMPLSLLLTRTERKMGGA